MSKQESWRTETLLLGGLQTMGVPSRVINKRHARSEQARYPNQSEKEGCKSLSSSFPIFLNKRGSLPRLPGNGPSCPAGVCSLQVSQPGNSPGSPSNREEMGQMTPLYSSPPGLYSAENILQNLLQRFCPGKSRSSKPTFRWIEGASSPKAFSISTRRTNRSHHCQTTCGEKTASGYGNSSSRHRESATSGKSCGGIWKNASPYWSIPKWSAEIRPCLFRCVSCKTPIPRQPIFSRNISFRLNRAMPFLKRIKGS